jgi:hypothetical protein
MPLGRRSPLKQWFRSRSSFDDSNVDDSSTYTDRYRLRAIICAEFLHDVLEVSFDGFFRDKELVSNIAIAAHLAEHYSGERPTPVRLGLGIPLGRMFVVHIQESVLAGRMSSHARLELNGEAT